MKDILISCYISVLLVACNGGQANISPLAQDVNPANESRQELPKSGGVTFSFERPNFTIKQDASVELKARFVNRTASSIYVANYFLSPSYYWQYDGVITASYLPFEYRKPRKGASYITLSLPVLYAQFREVRPGEEVEVPLKVPPKINDYWRLGQGKWQVKLQHIWVSDLKDFTSLTGQQLLDALKRDGHIVWAQAELLVE